MHRFSEDLIQKVWDKERASFNQDPVTWRKDACGAWIRREHYGRKDSEYGWEIDFITPGGPAVPSNLRAVQWQNNGGAAGNLVCRTSADPDTVHNRQARQT